MKRSFFLLRLLGAVCISASVLLSLSLGPVSCSMDSYADGGTPFSPGTSGGSGSGSPGGSAPGVSAPAGSGGAGASGLNIRRAVPPVLQSFTVEAADAMLLCFDKPVSVTNASLSLSAGGGASGLSGAAGASGASGSADSPGTSASLGAAGAAGGGTGATGAPPSPAAPDRPIAVTSESCGDGTSVRLVFAEETQIGSVYDMTALASDTDGNTLTFTITFDAFNGRLPELLLCELRNAYSSKSNKYEFVRLYCTKSGNLSGLELVNAGDGAGQAFVFPPVEVAAGEYICVHLRKMKDDGGSWMQAGMTDETDGNRRASTAVDSSDDAWDFWQDNQKSRLSPSDIVLVQNRTNGTVLDAFLFRDPKKESGSWDGKYEPFCRAVEQSGRWLDGQGQAAADFASAFPATNITTSAVTRTMKRRNLEFRPSSAADWYVAQPR